MIWTWGSHTLFGAMMTLLAANMAGIWLALKYIPNDVLCALATLQASGYVAFAIYKGAYRHVPEMETVGVVFVVVLTLAYIGCSAWTVRSVGNRVCRRIGSK